MRVSLVFTGQDLHFDAGPVPDGPLPVFRPGPRETQIVVGGCRVFSGGWLMIDGVGYGQLVGVVVDHLDTEREVPLHGS